MKTYSFIIPNYRCSSTLAECIGSIKDQDYPEKEIIVINDSPDESAEKILKTFPEVRHAVTGDRPRGAPFARNLGFSMATGDYFVAFDPDTTLMPGALRAWSEAFDEHPDCGFVYSGYKIKGLQGHFPSEEFDPYFLKIYNYINGMNPIRREVFPGWDVDCKSLQDWDLMLRMVLAGVKGHYLGKNVYYYETDPPRPDGISTDSHNNWLERVAYVKKKNNLPNRDICITSFAAAGHARRVAKMLNIDYLPVELIMAKPTNYKMVYILGFFPENGANNYAPFFDLKTGYFKKDLKCVVHWVGTDVYHMNSMITMQQLKPLIEGYNKTFVHLSQSEKNWRELKDLGLKAELMPLPIDVPELEVKFPMPEKFTVAIYDHGQGKDDIYCAELMGDIVRSMPDVDFICYGEDFKIGGEKNYKFVGVAPINEIIEKSSCLLRITRHDGFPVSPVEFMVHDRLTITNNDFPYQKKVEFDGTLNEYSVPRVKKRIIEALRDYIDTMPDSQYFVEARKYYRNLLSPHKLKRRLTQILEVKKLDRKLGGKKR